MPDCDLILRLILKNRRRNKCSDMKFHFLGTDISMSVYYWFIFEMSQSNNIEYSDEDDTQYSSEDDLVEKETRYWCRECGNETYGSPHWDCYGQCANCAFYFAIVNMKRVDKEGHEWDEELLCRHCYRVTDASPDEIPDVKEPEK